MLLELVDVLREVRGAPRKIRDAVAQTAHELGFDVLPEIYANVKKDADGRWEIVVAALDSKSLPEPRANEFRARARLDFYRAEEPSGVSNKGPENNG